jgi:hypothetical protein
MEIFLKYTKLSFSLASAACTYFSLQCKILYLYWLDSIAKLSIFVLVVA